MRDGIAEAKRVVVKIGSSSLASLSGGLDLARVDVVIDAIAARRAAGAQVVLASSGAVAAGLAPLGINGRPKDPSCRKAAASVGQAYLIHGYVDSFARHGVRAAQLLLTPQDLVDHQRRGAIKEILERLIELGIVPVINQNDISSSAVGQFDNNDLLAALVARLVGATALVLLSDVGGLFDADPCRYPARLLTEVGSGTDLSQFISTTDGSGPKLGTGGISAKVAAIRLATTAGIPVILASALHAQEALSQARTGTAFAAADEAGFFRWDDWVRPASASTTGDSEPPAMSNRCTTCSCRCRGA